MKVPIFSKHNFQNSTAFQAHTTIMCRIGMSSKSGTVHLKQPLSPSMNQNPTGAFEP
jgi:hypothetical protein